MKKRSVFQLVVTSTVFTLCALTLLSSANAVPNSAAANAVDGAAVYARRCAICHAKDGAGAPTWRAKGQPSFADSSWQRSHSDSQIGESIKNGKGKNMPAFREKLSDEEVGALVGQIRHFAR